MLGVVLEGGSTVVGTFGYMAPEQFQGRALPGSDVYAVGATALSLPLFAMRLLGAGQAPRSVTAWTARWAGC